MQHKRIGASLTGMLQQAMCKPELCPLCVLPGERMHQAPELVQALNVLGATEANKLLQKGVRLFSVPYRQGVPRIEVERDEQAAEGSQDLYTARARTGHVEWVPSADQPLLTRSHEPASVSATGPTPQVRLQSVSCTRSYL